MQPFAERKLPSAGLSLLSRNASVISTLQKTNSAITKLVVRYFRNHAHWPLSAVIAVASQVAITGQGCRYQSKPLASDRARNACRQGQTPIVSSTAHLPAVTMAAWAGLDGPLTAWHLQTPQQALAPCVGGHGRPAGEACRKYELGSGV